MNVLIIQGDTVVNVICADSEEHAQQYNPDAECLEQSGERAHVGIGWVRDATGVWSEPVREVQE